MNHLSREQQLWLAQQIIDNIRFGAAQRYSVSQSVEVLSKPLIIFGNLRAPLRLTPRPSAFKKNKSVPQLLGTVDGLISIQKVENS